MEPISMVMRRTLNGSGGGGLGGGEGGGNVDMKQKTSQHLPKQRWRERPYRLTRLRLKDTVRTDMKACKIKEESAPGREKGKDLCKTR